MGFRIGSGGTLAVNGTVVSTTSETVVAITPNIVLPTDNAQVFIIGWLNIALGTGTTAITLRVRRGSGTGGTALGTPFAANAVAGQQVYYSIAYPDTPGVVGTAQYSFTVAQSAATGNGTITDGCILAMVL